MALAVASIALTFSCTGNKTAQEASENDSTNVADSVSAANNELDLATVAGTYEGVLPAADCPGIKTVLTINADSTYQCARIILTARMLTTRQAAFCMCSTAVC